MGDIRRYLSETAKPLAEELPVVRKDRLIPGDLLECPHCKQEILEKHIFRENGRDYHSDCGKPIKMPAPSAAELAWLDQFKRVAPKVTEAAKEATVESIRHGFHWPVVQ